MIQINISGFYSQIPDHSYSKVPGEMKIDIDIVEHKIEVMDSDGQQDVIDIQDKDDIHHGNTNISEDPLMLEPGESSQFVDCGESIKQEIEEEVEIDETDDPLSFKVNELSCDVCQQVFSHRVVLFMHKDLNH